MTTPNARRLRGPNVVRKEIVEVILKTLVRLDAVHPEGLRRLGEESITEEVVESLRASGFDAEMTKRYPAPELSWPRPVKGYYDIRVHPDQLLELKLAVSHNETGSCIPLMHDKILSPYDECNGAIYDCRKMIELCPAWWLKTMVLIGFDGHKPGTACHPLIDGFWMMSQVEPYALDELMRVPFALHHGYARGWLVAFDVWS